MNVVPEKELISLALEVGKLKKVIRSGWKKQGVKKPESVADHTWRVAMLAMVLAPQLKVNQSKLIKMALVHDLAEIITGDIIWEKGKKVTGSQQQKIRDERKAMQSIFSDNPGFKEYITLWEEYEAQKSKEAKTIKALDKLEMAMQALEYEKDGYSKKSLQEFWDNAQKHIKGSSLAPYFDELVKLRSSK